MSDFQPDHELLRLAASGDDVAQKQLLMRHQESLTKYIRGKIPDALKSKLSADDVMQQTLLQVLRSIAHFSPRHELSFYAWMRRIADNVLIDRIRRYSKERQAPSSTTIHGRTLTDRSHAANLVDLLSDGGHTASRSAIRHEAIIAAQEALNRLPDDYRQAIELRVFLGKSLKASAAIMQRSPRAVQGLVDRAKKKMRDELSKISLYE